MICLLGSLCGGSAGDGLRNYDPAARFLGRYNCRFFFGELRVEKFYKRAGLWAA